VGRQARSFGKTISQTSNSLPNSDRKPSQALPLQSMKKDSLGRRSDSPNWEIDLQGKPEIADVSTKKFHFFGEMQSL
jgi:hypothetical protein